MSSRALEHARSMMAPGNPVPADAFGDSWDSPPGRATFQRIVAHPRDSATTVRRADRRPARRRPGRRRPGRHWVLAGSAAVAVLIGAVAVLAGRPAARPGQLTTAPMLHYTLTGVAAPVLATQLPPARALLLRLGRIAGRQPARPRPPGADIGYVLTNEWYMSVAVAGGTNTVAITPQVDQTWTAPDGTARQVEHSGKPWVGPIGSLLTLRGVDHRRPASDSTSRTTEQFGPLVAGLSANPARLRAQLLRASEYRGDPRRVPEAYQLMGVIADLQHQPVPPRLEAAIWRVLAGQPDIRYLGTVIDRAGRRGDAVATTIGRAERLVLIISPSTGRLLGEEDIDLTNPGALNIRKFPIVTSYVAYLSQGWTTSTAKVPGP
jgi:hypothetical protein